MKFSYYGLWAIFLLMSLFSISSSTGTDALLSTSILGLNKKSSLIQEIKARPNEYVSYAIYYWPDPDHPQGKWKSIDGKKNQTLIEEGDLSRLAGMHKTVGALCRSYAKNRNEDYAKRAGEWLKYWFINPATAMAPHLTYSQIRPGWETTGMGGGIIDMAHLPNFLESVRLLENSSALMKSEWKIFRKWMQDYGTWLATSPQGKHEMKSSNNHFAYYMAQRAALALFLEQKEDCSKILKEAFDRFDSHIAPDGSQPKEIKRAKGLSYSIYALRAWMSLAKLGENCGMNLWNYKSPLGASISKAAAYLPTLTETESKDYSKEIDSIQRLVSSKMTYPEKN